MRRVMLIRGNASRKIHEELDESDELDSGDPDDFALQNARLLLDCPWIKVVGGCCGSDVRHLKALLSSALLVSDGEPSANRVHNGSYLRGAKKEPQNPLHCSSSCVAGEDAGRSRVVGVASRAAPQKSPESPTKISPGQTIQQEIDGGVDDDEDVVDHHQNLQGHRNRMLPELVTRSQMALIKDDPRHGDLQSLHGQAVDVADEESGDDGDADDGGALQALYEELVASLVGPGRQARRIDFQVFVFPFLHALDVVKVCSLGTLVSVAGWMRPFLLSPMTVS